MPRKPRFGRIYRRKYNGQESGPWWVEFYVDHRQIRESSKSTRYSDAERLLRQRVSEIETDLYAPQAKRVTVATLLNALLLDYETNEKSVSWAKYVDGHLRPFFWSHVGLTDRN